MAGEKASKAEVTKRVEEVLRIRLDGAQWHDVIGYAAGQQWNVSERQVGRYLAAADKQLVARRDKGRTRLITRHHAMRMTLYARAVNAADYRTALAILQDEAKLRGLYPPPPAPLPPLEQILNALPHPFAEAVRAALAAAVHPATPQPDPAPPDQA